MNRLRSVVNNTLISLIGQGVNWGSTLLLTIAYGRFLGDAKFGELYFATSFILLIASPLEFSFNQQITRDVALEPGKAPGYFSNTLILKLLLWLILFALALLSISLLGYSTEERLLVAISGVTLLATAISSIVQSLHYSFESVLHPVIANILENGLAAVVGFILLKNGAGVEVIACVLLGGAIVGMIWQTIWLFRLIGMRFTIDVSLIYKLVRTAIPFLIYGMLLVIYGRIDTFLLSLLTNTEVVGWYGASYRLFDTLLFLPALIINPIMYPIFSKLSATSEEALKLAIEKCANFLLFLSIPMTIGLIVIAPNIIGFLYQNPEFVHSIPALQALAPGIIFLYLNTLLTSVMISTKQEKKILIMAAIALVFNLGLNLLLIPHYQQVAAALLTTLTEVLLFGLALVFIPSRLLPWRSLGVASKALLASLAMTLVLLLLLRVHANLLELLPIAIVVYFSVALLIRTVPSRDLRSLYDVIRRRSQPDPVAGEVTMDLPSVQPPSGIAATPTTPLPAFRNEQGWHHAFGASEELTDNLLLTTMRLPVFRMPLGHLLPATPMAARTAAAPREHAPACERGETDQELLLEGYRYQLAGIYHLAVQRYDAVIARAPQLLDEVINNVRALVKLEPDYAAGHRVLGAAYSRQGNTLGAMEAYGRARTLARQEYTCIAQAYQEAARTAAAPREHAPACERGETDQELLLEGYRYQLAGIYHLTVQRYDAVIARAPQLLDEVINNVRALVKLEPDYAAGHRVLGAAYSRQGNTLGAMEAYGRARTLARQEYTCIAQAYQEAARTAQEEFARRAAAADRELVYETYTRD